jgi:hypothetical protein
MGAIWTAVLREAKAAAISTMPARETIAPVVGKEGEKGIWGLISRNTAAAKANTRMV